MKKGYKVNLDKIEEGYLYSEYSCLAESRNEAKKILLKNFDGKLKYETDQVSYLTIPIVRYKEIDEIEFEGEIKNKQQIESILSERRRIASLDLFLADPSVVYMYIKKGGYYYRPNECGYTEFITMAGVYEKEDAVRQAKSVRELRLIPINIEEHNKNLLERIEELKSRIIL